MITSSPNVHGIEAILFDMNGTLRKREAHQATQHAAFNQILELLEKNSAPDSFWQELIHRQKAYSCWAQAHLSQLSQEEIWTGWLLPEYPAEKIRPIAAELMLAWGRTKGHHVPNSEAEKTIRVMKQRGYRLGVISNSMSTLDIPLSLEAFGWKALFDVVILSANIGIRKPSPEPFLIAARQLRIPPVHCAYLGNRISKDLVGCKSAGYGLGMLLEPKSDRQEDDALQEINPDVSIKTLGELLDIFPARGVQ
jgi:putative hydrolase of the HAD superfamily